MDHRRDSASARQFRRDIPVVYNGPYEYSVPGASRDFVMQTDPATVKAH